MAFSKFVPVIATAALLPAACGNSSNSFEVRGLGWVDTVGLVEQKFVGGQQFSSSCVVRDGARISVDTDNMTATVTDGNNENGVTGTACPDGAKFVTSQVILDRVEEAANAQATLRVDAEEAASLDRETGEKDPIAIQGWFATINEPEQQFRRSGGGTYGVKMELGESCVLDLSRTVYVLGKLGSGNFAALVSGGDELAGTPCPDGAIILVSQDEMPLG